MGEVDSEAVGKALDEGQLDGLFLNNWTPSLVPPALRAQSHELGRGESRCVIRDSHWLPMRIR